MVESKKEYLKIWFSDIDAAADYFDGNQKHLGEFLLNVYRSYAELPTNFSCKLVEKYFKTYQKQIDYIKGQKIKGALRHDNKEVIEHTLVGCLEPTLLPTLLPKEKREKVKDKEDKDKEQFPFEDFWNIYNKKDGKAKSEIAYKKLSLADKEKIFLTLPTYVKSTPNIQYRKNPLTYLNGQHWNDEIASTDTSTIKAIKPKIINYDHING